MIVDSTRSGKRFPDALTKTVPIWCCVINRAVADCHAAAASSSEREGAAAGGVEPEWWDRRLWLPEWVSASEASQIERLLEGFVASLRRPVLAPVLEQIRRQLQRPLRPVWCCPAEQSYGGKPEWHVGRAHGSPPSNGDSLSHSTGHREPDADGDSAYGGLGGDLAGYSVVQCVCASTVRSAEVSRRHHSWSYVQGAGDDEENWAAGLRPDQWWKWSERLLELSAHSPEAAEAELVRLQAEMVASTMGGGNADMGRMAAEGGGEACEALIGSDKHHRGSARSGGRRWRRLSAADAAVGQWAARGWLRLGRLSAVVDSGGRVASRGQWERF